MTICRLYKNKLNHSLAFWRIKETFNAYEYYIPFVHILKLISGVQPISSSCWWRIHRLLKCNVSIKDMLNTMFIPAKVCCKDWQYYYKGKLNEKLGCL